MDLQRFQKDFASYEEAKYQIPFQRISNVPQIWPHTWENLASPRNFKRRCYTGQFTEDSQIQQETRQLVGQRRLQENIARVSDEERKYQTQLPCISDAPQIQPHPAGNLAPSRNYEPCCSTQQCTEDFQMKQETRKLVEQYGILKSETDDYQIHRYLSEGTFAKVAMCRKVRTKEMVAVKITRAKNSSKIWYENECDILRRLNKEDLETFPFVRALDFFSYNHRGFVVFEMMEQSLADFLNGPLPLFGVRCIARQLFTGLAKLQELRIIHADIKPENIMLVDHRRQPFRIKLIDFGSSFQMPVLYLPTGLQTMWYRSPEVMLHLPYDGKIDMWSVGCVLAELLLGGVLYPGNSEYHMMRYIQETHGVPPSHMLNGNPKADEFFNKERRSNDGQANWRLKTKTEYAAEAGTESYQTRTHFIESLEDILHINADATFWSSTRKTLEKDLHMRKQCTDLLKRMLAINPEERISAEIGLRHGFFQVGRNYKNKM